jgi:hypothetical protein
MGKVIVFILEKFLSALLRLEPKLIVARQCNEGNFPNFPIPLITLASQ